MSAVTAATAAVLSQRLAAGRRATRRMPTFVEVIQFQAV
jgi:hypothetical protein